MKRTCRKALGIALCLTAFCCCVSGPAPYDDGADAEEARFLLRAAAGVETLNGEQYARSDSDRDGKLTPADARLALRISVGLPVSVCEDPGFGAYEEDVVDFRSCYTNDAMREDLALLQRLMPSRFSYRSLGTTADGRDIFCAVLGSGYGSSQIVIDAGTHGSEYLNPAAVMRTVEYCLRNYDSVVYRGKTVREILSDTDLYILPMLNPDGIAISQFGLEGLHSAALADSVKAIYERQAALKRTKDSLSDYLRVWKANANGVDLNRNFLFERTGMSYDTGVYEPANEEYAGDRNHPEAETAAYRTLIESLPHPVAVLSIHSQGNLIYSDCRQSLAVKKKARRLARLIGEQTGYFIVSSDSFVSASADWTTIEKEIPSVTVECGKGHNPLPLEQQEEISQKLRNVFLAVAESFG